MSCHISALCTTLPYPKRGLAEATLGRGIHWGRRRCPSRPIKTPATPQPLPPPCVAGVHLWGEHLPPHSTISHEQGGVKHLSLFRFVLERHIIRRRKSPWLGDLFSGQSGPTVTVSSKEDQITDQKMVLGRISFLLDFWRLRITVRAHLRKAAHPSHWVWVKLDHIFSWNFGRRKSSQEA